MKMDADKFEKAANTISDALFRLAGAIALLAGVILLIKQAL